MLSHILNRTPGVLTVGCDCQFCTSGTGTFSLVSAIPSQMDARKPLGVSRHRNAPFPLPPLSRVCILVHYGPFGIMMHYGQLGILVHYGPLGILVHYVPVIGTVSRCVR